MDHHVLEGMFDHSRNDSRSLLHKLGSLQVALQMIVECGNEEHVTGMARLVDDMLNTARNMLNPEEDEQQRHIQQLEQLQQIHLQQQQQQQQQIQNEQHIQQIQNQQQGDDFVSNGIFPKAEDAVSGPWLEEHLYQAMAMVKREEVAVNHGTPEVDHGNNSDDGTFELVQMDAMEILAEHTHFCEICGKGFKRDANLRMHMRGHGDEYKSPAALARPEAAYSSGPPAKKKRYSCPYVGCKRNREHKKFVPLKTILCVKNHYRRSHCPKKLTCTRCGVKKFAVLADLKTHEKHCGREKWQCSCGTTFSRKDKLLGHVALFVGHSPLWLHPPSLGSIPILIPSSCLHDPSDKKGCVSSSSASSSSRNSTNFQEQELQVHQLQQIYDLQQLQEHQQHQELEQKNQELQQQQHQEMYPQQQQEIHRNEGLQFSKFASEDDESWNLFAAMTSSNDHHQLDNDNTVQSFGFLGLDFLEVCKN